MRFSFLPHLTAAALALGLSACASYPPMVPTTAYVEKVDVELKQEVTSPTIAGLVSARTRRESTRYSHAGTPKHIRIAITRLHYKDAIMSAIVGDANSLGAHVWVKDAATGQPHGEFDTVVIDQGALNGIAGIMISVMQDKAQVDQRLAERLASDVMEHVYGSEVAKTARQRPVVEVEAAPAAAPATPAPAKPAPAKTKAKEPKTAMVGAPAQS